MGEGERMIDKNGKEIHIGDVVTWPYSVSWRGPRSPHKGIVICCLPAYEHMPDHIRLFIKSGDCKMPGRYMNSAINRVIVEVERKKSCPMLYCPRPTSVEVVT